MTAVDVFSTHAKRWILETEGRYSIDPNDRGNWTGGKVGLGELRGTKYGIAAAHHPGVDVAALTPAEALEIYRAEYWTPVRGDELPPALALAVFDAAVNHGVKPAVMALQRALHVTPDGVVGPITLDAARHATLRAVLPVMLARRAEIYRADPASAHYFHGWMVRLFRLALTADEIS